MHTQNAFLSTGKVKWVLSWNENPEKSDGTYENRAKKWNEWQYNREPGSAEKQMINYKLKCCLLHCCIHSRKMLKIFSLLSFGCLSFLFPSIHRSNWSHELKCVSYAMMQNGCCSILTLNVSPTGKILWEY